MIGETFEPSSEICGAVVSVRKHGRLFLVFLSLLMFGSRIAIWTKNCNEGVARRIGEQWRRFGELDNSISFSVGLALLGLVDIQQSHDDASHGKKGPSLTL